jgi:hypothetical protein
MDRQAVGTSMADAILDALEARGGRCLVGIPDPAFLALFQRAEQRGFTLISPHHEAAGGFMAEAAARLTGKPVAVTLSPGPGVANALPAMACASVEKAPVLFLGAARGPCANPICAGVSNMATRWRWWRAWSNMPRGLKARRGHARSLPKRWMRPWRARRARPISIALSPR